MMSDSPRTQFRTFRVQKMDLSRTAAGPSAYFLRTLRVLLNKKQEIQVFASGLVTAGVEACEFSGTVEK